jgi:hypothetical protein
MDPTKVWRKWRAAILQWNLSTVKAFQLAIFSIKTFDLDLLQLIVSNNTIVAHSIRQIWISFRFFQLKLVDAWAYLL